jgi:hypothetical protein
MSDPDRNRLGGEYALCVDRRGLGPRPALLQLSQPCLQNARARKLDAGFLRDAANLRLGWDSCCCRAELAHAPQQFANPVPIGCGTVGA